MGYRDISWLNISQEQEKKWQTDFENALTLTDGGDLALIFQTGKVITSSYFPTVVLDDQTSLWHSLVHDNLPVTLPLKKISIVDPTKEVVAYLLFLDGSNLSLLSLIQRIIEGDITLLFLQHKCHVEVCPLQTISHDTLSAKEAGELQEVLAEKKSVELALQEKNRFLQKMLDTIPIRVLWKSRSGFFLGANKRVLEDMGGISESDFIGRSDYDFLPKEQADFYHNKNREIIESKQSQTEIMRHVENDGTIRWLRVTQSPLISPSKVVEGILVCFDDISDIKDAEDRLRHSEEKFRTMIDCTYDWEYWQNPDRTIRYMTPSVERITGYKSQEFITNKNLLSEIIHPWDQDIFKRRFDDITEKRELEFRIICKNEAVIWIHHFSQPIYDKKGVYKGVRVSNRDITTLKVTQDNLIKSEMKFRSIFDLSPIGIGLLNFEGQLLDCNSALVTLLGNTKDEIVGTHYKRFIAPSDISKATTLIKSIRERYDTMANGEIVIKTVHNGSIIVDVWVKNIGFLPDYGEVFIAALNDITSEKEAGKKIIASEEKFRTMIDWTYDWEYWRNPDGTIRYMTPSVERITGYEASKFLGNSSLIVDIVYPDDKELYCNHLNTETIDNSLPAEEFEFRIVSKSGAVVWIGHACRPVFSDTNEYLGRRVSNRDITDQKQLYLKLETHRKQFALFANNIEEVFALLNVKTLHLDLIYEKPFEAVFGYPFEICSDFKLLVKTLFASYEERVQLNQLLGQLIHGELNYTEFNHEILRGDTEERRIISFSVGVVDNHDDEIEAITIICKDITEDIIHEEKEKLREEQLRQADKMVSLGILVSGVAHEINNPNNLIMLNADFMNRLWGDIYPILDEKFAENPDLVISKLPYKIVQRELPALIDGISLGSKRIKGIVQGLKDFVRSDSGRLDQVVNVNKVVEDALLIVNNVINKATESLEVTLSPRLPTILGNGQQLEQVIINLLTNACQALTSVEQKISIGTFVEGESVVIAVSDSGKGMDEEVLKNIFNPFFTTKRDIGGTGLGLSVSFRIIEEHRGQLLFQSEKGVGTTARILIPIPSKNNEAL